MAAFHYIVRAKLIRDIHGNGDFDFLQFEEKFEDENPIHARNLAFKHYQSYIDVLLESKGKKYHSDKQAREELAHFIGPNRGGKLEMGGYEIDFSDSIDNGIGIFLIIDTPKPENILEYKEGDEIFIHGIGHISFFSNDPDRLITELEIEHEYYKYFNYDTNFQEKEIVFCSSDEWGEGYTEDEPSKYVILDTPYDWTGLDKPYWWEEKTSDEITDNNQPPITLKDIIDGGESNQVEFKPSLLFNFSTGKPGIGIKGIIAKTICAFLNSNGGFLFIGLNDKGEAQGLSHDFSLSGEKSEKDFFKLEFDQMLAHFLSFSVKSNVSGEFYQLEDKDLFVVTVTPSKHRPIFLNGQEGKEFYIRGEASSRQITDLEELANYCIDNWGANDN